jgi:hypothetical protein
MEWAAAPFIPQTIPFQQNKEKINLSFYLSSFHLFVNEWKGDE